MCGIVILRGPRASSRIRESLERIRHRGPDELRITTGRDLAVGFARLAINGHGPESSQPAIAGTLTGVINGEIYNFRELQKTYDLPRSESDTAVLLPLVKKFGSAVIDVLDGFYAAAVIDGDSDDVLCLRDHIGKKPLFVGKAGTEYFVTSELKATIGLEWFRPVPTGASVFNTVDGSLRPVRSHVLGRTFGSLAQCLEAAVLKRLPAIDQKCGVFLSGGLDSSLVASFVAPAREDAVYFTLGGADSPDLQAVRRLAVVLELRDVRQIALPEVSELPELVARVVVATESYNPSIVTNGLATYLLGKAASEAGVKVVLTGEGADEFFGGYHHFESSEPWRETREKLIADLPFTELRRLDLATMAHSVEVRCPFFDQAIRSLSDELEYEEFYSIGRNKVALRKLAAARLPNEIAERQKSSFDVGSGLRRLVVAYLRRNGRSEREELWDIWKQNFPWDGLDPYFSKYPVFDAAIDVRTSGHVP